MSAIYFITGNQNKLREARAFVPEIEAWDLDLPEIQDSEPQPVIEAKLLAALALGPDHPRLLVEDTGLYLGALKGLPGPLIKWFIQKDKLGLEGLYQLTQALHDDSAEAVTVIGYLEKTQASQRVHYFEGRTRGRIVSPQGQAGFGWDAIFMPEGSTLRFAEMSPETKASLSMRRKAFEKFRRFLDTAPSH